MRRAGKGDAPFPWRLFLLGLLSAVLYGMGNYWQPALTGSIYLLYVLWISFLFALYFVAITQVLRGQEVFHPWSIYIIVGGALLFRLSLVWVPPGFLSDDLYRYLWDGLVQRAGINPYQYPPAATELAFLRDDIIFPMINRKEALTIYPPGAQLFFWGMAWGWPGSVVALKGAILIADACSVALLLLLLRHLDINRCHVLLYAWNPLVVVELALSGHLDGVMLPFLLGAVLLTLKQRSRPAGLLLGLATLIKLYPAILLPVLYRKRSQQLLVVWAVTLGLGYLLYLGAGSQVAGYLPGYLGPGEEFNLGLRQMLLYILGFVTDAPHRTVLWLTSFVLLLAAVQCLRSDRQTSRHLLGWAVGMIALYLLLVSPSVHPWYLVWLVALASVIPTWSTPGWLYWSWSVYLDILAYLPGLDGYAHWIRFAEYGPLFLWLGGYALWRCCRSSSKTHSEPCHQGGHSTLQAGSRQHRQR
jgi:alpha-1,6-mannosyltransferase